MRRPRPFRASRLAPVAIATLLAFTGALSACSNGDDTSGEGGAGSDGGADATLADGGRGSGATDGSGGGPTSSLDGTVGDAANGGGDDASATGDDGGGDSGGPGDASDDAEGSTSFDAGQDAGPDAGPLSGVHLYGRIDTRDPAGPRFDWAGSTVRADFTGTGIAVTLVDVNAGNGPNQLEVVVDDTPQSAALVLDGSNGGRYVLASNLTKGPHHVEISKRTEGFDGLVQLISFSAESTADTSWALVPKVDPYPRKLEFVGDSITNGYGVLGANATCSESTSVEDNYLAYGAVAARTLGASQVSIAYSGIGVYRDVNKSTTNQLPSIYPRTLVTDSTSVYSFATQVDAVVVNLGTNDFSAGDPGQPFITAYEGLVATIRLKYPSAYILLVAGPMLTNSYPFDGAADKLKTYLDQIVAHANDTNVGDIQVAIQPDCGSQPTMCGCDDHPDISTQAYVAAAVVTQLRAAKGW